MLGIDGELAGRDVVPRRVRVVLREAVRDAAGRFIAVRAALDNKTYSEPQNMFEENPELAERLYNVVLEFSRPVVRRRKPVIGRGPRPEEDKK